MKKKLFLLIMSSLSFGSCSKKITPIDSISIRYNNHLYLNVNVKDKIHGNFIFDTGWNGVSLDSLFCNKNGLDYKTKDIKISGIGNSTRTAKLITDTIHFKFSEKEDRFSTSTAMLDLKSMVGKTIDGIAGIQTFAQKPYMIDYVSQKIIFINSVKGYESVNAQFEDYKIYLPLSIILKNGKKIQGKFMLDTGSDQTILNSNFFMSDGIHNATDKKKFFAKGGVGGDSNGYFLPVVAADLGKFKLKKLIMTVSTDTLGALANPNYMGIIGNDLLDDFNIIFDHQKEKIWLKPNKNFNRNKNKLFRSISFFDTGEKWIIAGIVENSEAYRKGIRMNDQIIEVNNVPVEKIDLDKFVEDLKANDSLHLRIKREDKKIELKLKLNVFIKS
ncbi:PDZ domain-containing protein [Flavobacterium soli]|uniref:PDZ domain-containing protein n=1 Tax=Flavobacterium soli TaxID=344881 RepID=UPI000400A8DB|nr:PDZ domain-containing protein [Flavobacterium soli]